MRWQRLNSFNSQRKWSVFPHVPLKKVHGAFALIRPHALQKVIEEDPLFPPPHTARQVERGSGCEREVVDPVRLQAVDLLR